MRGGGSTCATKSGNLLGATCPASGVEARAVSAAPSAAARRATSKADVDSVAVVCGHGGVRGWDGGWGMSTDREAQKHGKGGVRMGERGGWGRHKHLE